MALTDKLTNIADAIRTQTDTTDKMTLDEMPEKISKLGDISGYFLESASETFPKVSDFILKLPKLTFIAKKSTEATEIQIIRALFTGYSNLKKVPEIELIDYGYDYLDYSFMFQSCSKIEDFTNFILFLDKYKVCKANYMFAGCDSMTVDKFNEVLGHITLKPSVDSDSLTLENFVTNNNNITEINIPFNTSEVTSFREMMRNCRNLVTVSAFDCSSAKDMQSVFYGCYSLENLGGFINLGENLTSKTDFYLNLPGKVTHASLINILNGLYDISDTDANGSMIYLGGELLTNLSDEEKKIATDKGWTLR